MITISPLLRTLCIVTGMIPSDYVVPKCEQLINDFDGVVTPCRPSCIIVEHHGSYVHINITKKSPGILVADGLVCDSQSTKNVIHDVEYDDVEFHLTYISPNETCPLDNVGVMRLMFRSRDGKVKFSVKVIENYENEKNGTSNGKMEHRITILVVVFLLLAVFICIYKFLDFKYKESRLRAREIQLRHNHISQGIELPVLNKNDPDPSANLELSKHPEEMVSHSP